MCHERWALHVVIKRKVFIFIIIISLGPQQAERNNLKATWHYLAGLHGMSETLDERIWRSAERWRLQLCILL